MNFVSREEKQSFFIFNSKQEGIRYNAVMLVMKIDNLGKFLKHYGEEAYTILNKIYGIFHSEGIIYQGDIYTGRNLIIWKEDRPLVLKTFTRYIRKLGKYTNKIFFQYF